MMIEKEIFIDTLLRDFPEKLEDIINDCQYTGRGSLNIEELNTRLCEAILDRFVFLLNEDDWLNIMFELNSDKYDEFSYMSAA